MLLFCTKSSLGVLPAPEGQPSSSVAPDVLLLYPDLHPPSPSLLCSGHRDLLSPPQAFQSWSHLGAFALLSHDTPVLTTHLPQGSTPLFSATFPNHLFNPEALRPDTPSPEPPGFFLEALISGLHAVSLSLPLPPYSPHKGRSFF